MENPCIIIVDHEVTRYTPHFNVEDSHYTNIWQLELLFQNVMLEMEHPTKDNLNTFYAN